jgi:UDP:flavonoid glycosyltransferase YjiC (YdhE family)
VRSYDLHARKQSVAATMSSIKAHVVVGSMPFVSHFTPMQKIARNLVVRGYSVTFITGECFRGQVEQFGARCIVPASWEEMNDDWPQGIVARRAPGSFIDNANANAIEFFIRPMLAEFEAIQRVLTSSVAEQPDKPVVILTETNFSGALPLRLGAPGLQPKGIISVGINPILAVSIDTGPASHGILPDSSVEGRKRNASLNKTFLENMQPAHIEFNTILEQLGARSTELYRYNAIMQLSDIYLQLCPPSLEYPRSDAPGTLRFTGGLPRTESKSSEAGELPTWWDDIKLNPEKRHIVAVSQGTVSFDYSHLNIPTLQALKDRGDLFVVVALGKKGATLPEGTIIPGNARVADWIPYDELLALSDAFVTNGGYGGFSNALARGVPIVIAAPQFADKRDIADRVMWSGTGVNLKTGTPTSKMVRDAVMEVLTNEEYKRRALEIQSEIRSYDPMEIIAGAIDEVVEL